MQSIGNGSVVPRKSNGGLPINLLDQNERIIDLRFVKFKGNNTTLKSDAVIDASTIDLNDTTGYANGDRIYIYNSDSDDFYSGVQIGAPSGDTITLDTPIDCIYKSGSDVRNSKSSMNVDGSVTKQIFQVGPIHINEDITIDITKIFGVITDNLSMDDSLFGSMANLTKGCVLRKNNGRYINYMNYKNHGDIALHAGQPNQYIEKGVLGAYSVQFSISFAGQSNHGVAIRLYPGDLLEFIIQDNLTSLLDFQMAAQGQAVVY